MVRGGTVIVRMISSEAPATDLPQWAVILVVVRRVLITLKAVREGGGRPRPLTLLPRKEVKASLRDCSTLEAVASIFVDPF
jgi:hypothetical protein